MFKSRVSLLSSPNGLSAVHGVLQKDSHTDICTELHLGSVEKYV